MCSVPGTALSRPTLVVPFALSTNSSNSNSSRSHDSDSSRLDAQRAPKSVRTPGIRPCNSPNPQQQQQQLLTLTPLADAADQMGLGVFMKNVMTPKVIPRHGYRVLRVDDSRTPNILGNPSGPSPAAAADLIAFEDVIIAVNGVSVDYLQPSFSSLFSASSSSPFPAVSVSGSCPLARRASSEKGVISNRNRPDTEQQQAPHFSSLLSDLLERPVVLTLYNDNDNSENGDSGNSGNNNAFGSVVAGSCVGSLAGSHGSSRDVTIVPSRRWQSQCFIGCDVRYDPIGHTDVLLPV